MLLTGPYDVAVLGGGITGLTAAFYLHQAGLKVIVLEQNTAVGGALQTARTQGYTLDCGPNTLQDKEPAVRRLLADLDLAGSILPTDPEASKRYILRGGKLHALAPSPISLLTTSLLSWKGKLRLLQEPFRKKAPAEPEESIDSFIRRRLGPEAATYLLDPFIAGIYAGQPAKISAQAACPELVRMEQQHGSLFKGFRASRAEQDGHKLSTFSLTGGMGQLAERLAERLGPERFALNCRVVGIKPISRGYSIRYQYEGSTLEVDARHAICNLPAYGLAPLVKSFAPTLAAELSKIPYPPLRVWHMAYPRAAIKHPLDGFGFLVPQVENKHILGAIFSSSLFAGRAPMLHRPGDIALFTVFVGGSRQPTLAHPEDSTPVHKDLAAILGIKQKPIFTHSYLWHRAIPQYEVGHLAHEAAFAAYQAEWPSFHLAANYTGGVSLPASIRKGCSLAMQILEQRVLVS